MGLALVYSGLKLLPGDEILQTVHDHYSTDLSIELRAERTGASVRRIALYDEPATASVDEILSRIRQDLRNNTRALAVTRVHSSTGVKLPDRAITDVDLPGMDCDFFIAGTHKWLIGPRGTGLIWGSPAGWDRCTAVRHMYTQRYIQRKTSPERLALCFFYFSCLVVGARGFEPPTPCTPCRCATRLRHAPTDVEVGFLECPPTGRHDNRWHLPGKARRAHDRDGGLSPGNAVTGPHAPPIPSVAPGWHSFAPRARATRRPCCT
jgi:hypothetical protein